MSGGLSAIPIRVENQDAAASTGTIGGGVTALLVEIASLLDRLADGGEPSAIDLRGLPMSLADRERLLRDLGEGEVAIALQADGESTIRETGVRGVWWVQHRDRGGEVLAEFIEIARVPGILLVDEDELHAGAQRLRAGVAHAQSQRTN
jgi:hydrogenase-1 operon protein HyaF